MNKRIKEEKEPGMNDKVSGRFYPPYDENPKYGMPFQVRAVQPVNIDREFFGWAPMILNDGELFKMGKTWRECQKLKQKLSDMVVQIMNSGKSLTIPLKEIAAIKIHYLGDPVQEIHII